MNIMEMEILNLLMNNDPVSMQKMLMLYATSPIARRFDDQIYLNGIPDNLKIPDTAVNRNAEIFNVTLKACGLGFNMGIKNK